MTTSSDTADLLILGGGLVGMALALAAAKKGMSSHVIDRADPAELTAEGFDDRATAISTASWHMFTNIGIAEGLEEFACDISAIAVTDQAFYFGKQVRITATAIEQREVVASLQCRTHNVGPDKSGAAEHQDVERARRRRQRAERGNGQGGSRRGDGVREQLSSGKFHASILWFASGSQCYTVVASPAPRQRLQGEVCRKKLR